MNRRTGKKVRKSSAPWYSRTAVLAVVSLLMPCGIFMSIALVSEFVEETRFQSAKKTVIAEVTDTKSVAKHRYGVDHLVCYRFSLPDDQQVYTQEREADDFWALVPQRAYEGARKTGKIEVAYDPGDPWVNRSAEWGGGRGALVFWFVFFCSLVVFCLATIILGIRYRLFTAPDLRSGLRNEQAAPPTGDEIREQADHTENPTEKIALLVRAAKVYATDEKSEMQAEFALRAARKIDPRNLDALDGLIELFEKADRPGRTVDILQKKLDVVDEVDRVSVYNHLARVYIQMRSDRYEARKAWRKALEIDPDNKEALDGLAQTNE